MDVESVLRKGEEAFKLEDFPSAFNIYTFGMEKIRYCYDCKSRGQEHLILTSYVPRTWR